MDQRVSNTSRDDKSLIIRELKWWTWKRVPIIFEFFWAPLPHDVPTLIADHGKMLPQLLQRLSLESA